MILMSPLGRTTRIVLLITIFMAFASQAFAKDVAGRFALGIDNSLTAGDLGIGGKSASPNSPNSPSLGLSLKYWIDNNWGIAGVLGFMYADAQAAKETYGDPDGIWAFSLDVKGLYNFSKGDKANLAAFLTLHLQKESVTSRRPEGPYHSNLGVALALGLSPELFFTDNFALTAELGLIFRVQEGFAVGIGTDNLLGGLGIHYYF